MWPIRKLYFRYSDWLRSMTRGERATFIAALLVLLSLWGIFALLMLVASKLASRL